MRRPGPAADDLSTGVRTNLAARDNAPNFRSDQADMLTWDRLDLAVGWADRIDHPGERILRTFRVPLRGAGGGDFGIVRHRRPRLARLRGLTGFKYRYTFEDAFDGLIAVERPRPQGEKDGHCTVVRHQSERAA